MNGIIRLATQVSTVRGLTESRVASWRLRTSCEADVVESFTHASLRQQKGRC